MRRILTGTAVFVLVFGLCLGASFAAMNYFHFKVLRVTSGSMEPMLPVGTRVIVRGDTPIERNDIVSFRNLDSEIGGVTTHIYGGKASDGTLLTRGMANEKPDDFTPAPTQDEVIGKMVAYTEAFTPGYWTSLRGTGAMLLFLAALITSVIVFRGDSEEDDDGSPAEDSGELAASTPA